MRAKIILEGGGDSKELQSRCREAFRKLLERCGFKGRMPRLVAAGGRDDTFDQFKTAYFNNDAPYVAMWLDSEEPLNDLEATWAHLKARDRWDKPEHAEEEQVLFMTICMESWIVADHGTIRAHFGQKLQTSALPTLQNLEARSRYEVQDALVHATRNCTNAFQKGKRSFEVVSKLEPDSLAKHLPSFVRIRRILDERL